MSSDDKITSTSPEWPFGLEDVDVDGRVCISLLGELRVWLGVDKTLFQVPIKSSRRQELLAYIATLAPTRSRRISSGRILTDVFEHIAPHAGVDNLRGLFQKHTQLLRKEVSEMAREIGFPKPKLFQFEKVDNSSTKWWLSEECLVVDLMLLRRLSEQLEVAKEEGEAGLAALKSASEQLIAVYQSYDGDYLEKHIQQDEFGDCDWVRNPFTEYRDMYLQALWDAAIAEHTTSISPSTTSQERYRAAKHAAALYRAYALCAPKHRGLDLNSRKSRRQSERALRGYLRMCIWLVDAQGADDCYSLYERLMKDQYPEWKPATSTIEILRTVRQNSGQNPLLSTLIEPPERD